MNGKEIDCKEGKMYSIGKNTIINTPLIYIDGRSEPLSLLVSKEQMDYIVKAYQDCSSSSVSDEYFISIKTLDGAYVTLNLAYVYAIYILDEGRSMLVAQGKYSNTTVIGLCKNNSTFELTTFDKRDEMDCHLLLESGDNTYPFLPMTDEDNEVLLVRRSEVAYMISDIKITEEEMV